MKRAKQANAQIQAYLPSTLTTALCNCSGHSATYCAQDHNQKLDKILYLVLAEIQNPVHFPHPANVSLKAGRRPECAFGFLEVDTTATGNYHVSLPLER